MIETFYEAIGRDLRQRGYDAVKVINVEEGMKYGGYCSTCSYEYVGLDITYKNSKGKTLEAEISETFIDYIRSLTD